MSGDVAIKMTEIRSTVDNSAIVIKRLDGKSQQIGEIISVITNIADQTNLLALNAAIEAARAARTRKGLCCSCRGSQETRRGIRKGREPDYGIDKRYPAGYTASSREYGTGYKDRGRRFKDHRRNSYCHQPDS